MGVFNMNFLWKVILQSTIFISKISSTPYVDPERTLFYEGLEESLTRTYQSFQNIFDIYLGKIPNIESETASIYHFWAYGCHCLPISGFPMSGGQGSPVDELDQLCYFRKKCVSCLNIKYGENCDTETVKYKWKNST